MIDREATLGHHLLQITQAQRIGHVPAHTQQDHVQRMVQALEHLRYASRQLLYHRYFLHDALPFRAMSAEISPRHP